MTDQATVNPYLVPSTVTHASGAGLPNTPRPPAVGLPVERIPGAYPDLNDGDEQGRQDGYDSTPGAQLAISPTPLIGAIPYGGLVIAAGVWAPQKLGDIFTIGDTGAGQPQNTTITIWTPAVTSSFEIVGDGLKDQPGPGALLPISGGALVNGSTLTPLTLPLRRATIRSTVGPGPTILLYYWTTGYPVGRGT